MYIQRVRGATSNILRATLRSSATGQGLTGLTSGSTGLIISTVCDNEASPVTYTAAGSTIETITTLGTFATPTTNKCRFKEVDATNHPGLYEFQFADARFSVASSKVLRITVSGATNLLSKDLIVQLTVMDFDDGVRGALTALPNAVPGASGGLVTTNGTKVNQTVDLTAGQTIAATIAAGSIATDAITAASVKADAVTKIQNGLALEATLTAIKGAGWSTETLAAIDVLIDAIKAKTDNLPASPAAVGSAMTLADDAITAAKFDESTAYPLKSADTGATAVARVGADSDTLETLSDQIDGITITASAVADAVWDEALSGHSGAGSAGQALSSAGSSADPLLNLVPGSYAAGTAGEALGYIDDIKTHTDLITTGTAITVQTGVDQGTWSIVRGDTLSQIFGPYGSLAAVTEIVVAGKSSPITDTDDASIFRITKTGGLTKLNGGTPGTGATGTVTVTDAVLGYILVTMTATATKELPSLEGGQYGVELKSTATVETVESGVLRIDAQSDVSRSV